MKHASPSRPRAAGRPRAPGGGRSLGPRRRWAPLALVTPVLALSVSLSLVPHAGASPVQARTPEAHGRVVTLALSKVLSLARAGDVRSAVVDSTTSTVTGTVRVGHALERFQSQFPAGYAGRVTTDLLDDHVTVRVAPQSHGSTLFGSLTEMLLLGLGLVLVGAWIMGSRRRGPGKGTARPGRPGSQSAPSPAGFAKGHGEQTDVPATRFSDVAGLHEAVVELRELVDFLHDPEPYKDAGADVPRGYLLIGPPGTGKTLLARAVAGEAGVPFFAIGASEFVESYVGVGAARVRSLFDRAREAGSAIVFIDELDAVGRARSSQTMPGNEERESTLNQLLVEMDGFSPSASVVVLAATNRPDILDHALLRPGRFDRQIAVPPPDRRGRSQILDLYLQRRHVDEGVDADSLSRRTAGFTGADLANLVNTAALLSVRTGTGRITSTELDEALATVALGPARKSAVVAARDREITAWHEAGHALAGLWLDDATDPESVSIVPRGQAGGVTWFPGHDDVFMSRRQANAQLVVSMAGRAAEELLLGDDFTQGASQDFRAATELARRMVTEYGMGSIGPGYVAPEETHIGVLAERVHAATDELLRDALGEARALLGSAREALERVVSRLLEEETLDRAALAAVAGPRPGAAALRGPALPSSVGASGVSRPRVAATTPNPLPFRR